MSNSAHITPEYQPTLDWLIASQEPWVVYNTLHDLVGTSFDNNVVQAAYHDMQQHPSIVSMLEDVQQWPAKPLDRAYDPKDAIWKLGTLADFGLQRNDERIAALAERIFAAQAEDGGFLHGGFGHTKSWDTRPYICVSHVMTYALASFGYLDDPRLDRAYAQLASWQRLDGGWHPNKLNLPGNARADEPSCPFGTINVLRAVAVHPTMCNGEVAHRAADYILTCWTRRSEPYRPVGFGIGTTWDKVQYPFVQYQLLKTIDTLSLIPAVHTDPRYQEIVARLKSKQTAEGRWLAESINKTWNAFDFGQKKAPSPWVTFLALRVIMRSI